MTYQVGDIIKLLSLGDVEKKYPMRRDSYIIIPNKFPIDKNGPLAAILGRETIITARSLMAQSDWVVEISPACPPYPATHMYICEELIECKVYPAINVTFRNVVLPPTTRAPLSREIATVLAPEICPCCGQCKVTDAMSATTKRQHKQCKLCGWKS